jgi:hypothetical protein
LREKNIKTIPQLTFFDFSILYNFNIKNKGGTMGDGEIIIGGGDLLLL